jgi:hypothetical protein
VKGKYYNIKTGSWNKWKDHSAQNYKLNATENIDKILVNVLFPMVQQPPVGHGLLSVEA